MNREPSAGMPEEIKLTIIYVQYIYRKYNEIVDHIINNKKKPEVKQAVK